MINIIGKRFWFFGFSALIIIVGLVYTFAFGLRPSIEFKSGSEFTVSFTNAVSKTEITQALAGMGYTDSIIRQSGADYIITLPELDDAAKEALRTGMGAQLGELKDGSFQKVSPKAASGLTTNTIVAVVIASIGMLLYISWAFRRMPNPFRWGVCAIIALIHDLLVVVGVFALMGGLFGWQIDLMFIAAVLTVIGYSVNDTIVIFDRIRENVREYGEADFEGVVNVSLLETMSRTLITGLGTIFVLLALLLVIGAQIQNLVVVLLVGVIVGTYSSFGTAASLLVVWKNKEWGRLIGRKPTAVAVPARSR